MDGLAVPFAFMVFAAGALFFAYYAVTPVPMLWLSADTFRYQRYPWRHVEIAWSDTRSMVPSTASGYPGIASTLVLTIDMKESVALTYPYGRRPSVRIPGLLLCVSYSDIIDAIAQHKQVLLIGAEWYRR